MHYFEATVGLSREFAVALSRPDIPLEEVRASEAHGGRPPSLRSERDVQRFLGATCDETSRIMKLGVIAPVAQGMIGYDADHIVGARRFLDSLLGLKELSAFVGLPVDAQDLHPAGLLPRWNPEARYDARVMVPTAMEIQLQLATCWHRSHVPARAESLRSLACVSDHPFGLVNAVVKEIIAGTISNFGWNPPFTWADLRIDVNDLPRHPASADYRTHASEQAGAPHT